MMFSKKVFHLTVPCLLALAAVAAPFTLAQSSASNVSSAVRIASDLGPADANQVITVTVYLKPQNEADFQKTVDELYDPASPTFHQWLSNDELKKFAPASQQIEAVQKELKSHGLTIVSTDENGVSLRARGNIASVEQAFNTHIHQFQHNGKTFRANIDNAQLSSATGSYVSAISGIESHDAHPLLRRVFNFRTNQPLPDIPLSKVEASGGGLSSIITDTILSPSETFTFKTAGASLPVGVYHGNVYDKNPNLIPDYTPAQLQQIYGLTDAYKQGLNGKGQTIVLLEAYGYPTIEQDANAFFKLAGLPQLNSSNFSIVYPEGKPVDPGAGVLTGWDVEIALDVQWSHSMAPGAKIIVVAAAGQDSEDFQDAIRYITNHHLGNAVSDSWEEDTDLIEDRSNKSPSIRSSPSPLQRAFPSSSPPVTTETLGLIRRSARRVCLPIRRTRQRSAELPSLTRSAPLAPKP
jgi:subtilase family serine protease